MISLVISIAAGLLQVILRKRCSCQGHKGDAEYLRLKSQAHPSLCKGRSASAQDWKYAGALFRRLV